MIESFILQLVEGRLRHSLKIFVSSSSGLWLSEFPRADLEQEQHAEPELGPTHGGLRSPEPPQQQ